MLARSRSTMFAAGIALILGGCMSYRSADTADDLGGCISFIVSNSLGVLNEDSLYAFSVEFADGRKIDVSRSFAMGTSVHRVAVELSDAFRANGFETVVLPELGVVRVGFVPGLMVAEASGGNGFSVSFPYGRRNSFTASG